MTLKKDTIVQFVCFITKLELDEFAPKWEQFAKRLTGKKQETDLQEHISESKNKFRYISRHEWAAEDFQFSFMNDRKSEHFPEQNVKVVQIGGYISQTTKKYHEKDSDVTLISFISHNETDMDFYRQLTLPHHLNIYQAFYENCTYGYILEFFVPENDSQELLEQLKQRPDAETGMYKACLAEHL